MNNEADRYTLRLTLAKLKSNLAWDTLRLFMGTCCRTRVLAFLRRYDWGGMIDPNIRFHGGRYNAQDTTTGAQVEIFPNCFGLIDTFPAGLRRGRKEGRALPGQVPLRRPQVRAVGHRRARHLRHLRPVRREAP